MSPPRRHFQKSFKKPAARALALTLAASTLAACVSPTASTVTGRYAAPIGNAPVISNETPYSRALSCLGNYSRSHTAPAIAVGQIADYTGKIESDGSGRKLTQGAALMAISALSKAGVRLVERFDTSVAELELKYANNKLIGDDQGDGFRKILAGSIEGSDYYLVGGITELNYNIRSSGFDAYGAEASSTGIKANADAKMYVMNVGLDLRLVDTKTLQVVDVISYQKQIIGRQIQAGVFDVLGTTIFNAGAGESALEPVQLAVRSVIERAVLEMVSRLYKTNPNACGAYRDPLGGGGVYAYNNQPQPQYQQPQPQYQQPANQQVRPQQEYRYVQPQTSSRQDPYSGYGSSDPVGVPMLRGGQ